jgi:hypothetical protein
VRSVPGLGLTNALLIDQHFSRHDRLGRLPTTFSYNPYLIGVGIDEDTALCIGPENLLEVEGSGSVTIIDPSELTYTSSSDAAKHDDLSLLNLRVHINVGADHMGLGGIETLQQLAKVKETVVRVANDTVVLNADDRLCLKMAGNTRARHICYVAMDAENGVVRQHIQANGRALVLEKGINGDMLTIYDHGAPIPLLWSHLIPTTIEGKALHNVQNAMFAAAMAYSFGKDLDEIRQGLGTFDTSIFPKPRTLQHLCGAAF